MKKIILTVFFLIFLVFLIKKVDFIWKNFSGVGPALKKPAKDITALFPKSEEPAENKTDFPLTIPDGFSINIFSHGLGKARVLTFDPNGNLLVSVPQSGAVYALPDKNGDGVADGKITVADGLNLPHGFAFRCKAGCQLYIAETDQVAVYNYDEKNLKATSKKKIIDLPAGGNHFSRTLLYDEKEDKLFVSIGSSCNVCNEDDDRRTKIFISDPDGKNLKVFASGLRNAVFMAFHPVTQKIWATEMGRDFLGDDLPPDEINIIEEGKNYGWPICYGKNIHDTDFDKNRYVRDPCMEPFMAGSYIDIPAHSAPLGLAFFPEIGWPEDNQYNLLVAYHGSWNRSVPTGYKVVRYKLDKNGKYLAEENFITGWLQAGEALGRPVDIVMTEKGTIFISDDKAGVIYRIKYQQ